MIEHKDAVMILCPSCIGLGKILYAGELRICGRCIGMGQISGIEQRDGNGKLLAYVPKEKYGYPE